MAVALAGVAIGALAVGCGGGGSDPAAEREAYNEAVRENLQLNKACRNDAYRERNPEKCEGRPTENTTIPPKRERVATPASPSEPASPTPDLTDQVTESGYTKREAERVAEQRDQEALDAQGAIGVVGEAVCFEATSVEFVAAGGGFKCGVTIVGADGSAGRVISDISWPDDELRISNVQIFPPGRP